MPRERGKNYSIKLTKSSYLAALETNTHTNKNMCILRILTNARLEMLFRTSEAYVHLDIFNLSYALTLVSRSVFILHSAAQSHLHKITLAF